MAQCKSILFAAESSPPLRRPNDRLMVKRTQYLRLLSEKLEHGGASGEMHRKTGLGHRVGAPSDSDHRVGCADFAEEFARLCGATAARISRAVPASKRTCPAPKSLPSPGQEQGQRVEGGRLPPCELDMRACVRTCTRHEFVAIAQKSGGSTIWHPRKASGVERLGNDSLSAVKELNERSVPISPLTLLSVPTPSPDSP